MDFKPKNNMKTKIVINDRNIEQLNNSSFLGLHFI